MISWSFIIFVVSQQLTEFADVNQREVNDHCPVVRLNALTRSRWGGGGLMCTLIVSKDFALDPSLGAGEGVLRVCKVVGLSARKWKH